jgi:molybdopterin-containing oxidoreductase family molybdopterin binding subunit
MQSNDMCGLWVAATIVTRGDNLHGNSFSDIKNSKNIFFWGTNPTTAHHVKFTYVQDAIDHGAYTVVVDPNYTLLASRADKWVPIRPGSDGVLIMAMINVIVEEGLLDADYLKRGSVAPFLVKESDGKFLRLSDLGLAEAGSGGAGIVLDGANSQQATSDEGEDSIVVLSPDGSLEAYGLVDNPELKGTYEFGGHKVTTAFDLLMERCAEWPVERASSVCDIPAETIKELARLFADGPSMSYVGFGMDHWVNGPLAYQCLFSMMAVAGQFGKPGASVSGAMTSTMGLVANTGLAVALPDHLPGPGLYGPKLLDVALTGKWGDVPVNPKALFCAAGNPCAGLAERNAFFEFLDGIESFVVADVVFNESACYADIVLPVSHWFEFESLRCTTGHAMLNEKAIDPLFESKRDIDIANFIGEGMGIGDIMNLSAEDYYRTILDTDAARAVGLDLDSLREKKIIRIQPDDFIFGENYTLPTPTGRFEFYTENVAPFGDYGQQFDKRLYAIPHWEPPNEGWSENPLAQSYPLVLMTQRDKSKVHTAFSDVPWLKEIWPEPTIHLNPIDADERNIQDGDYVKAFNERGYVVMKAVVDAGVRPGVALTQRAQNEDRYREGHCSSLFSRLTSIYAVSNAYYDTLCQIEKYGEG